MFAVASNSEIEKLKVRIKSKHTTTVNNFYILGVAIRVSNVSETFVFVVLLVSFDCLRHID